MASPIVFTTMVFPVIMNGCESWTVKKAERRRIDAFFFFATPWTIAHQALLSLEFSRQEYWGGKPFPTPGGLPNPGIELMSPALAGRSFTTVPPGKPYPLLIVELMLLNCGVGEDS